MFLIGYGTLLNVASLGLTIGPAIAQSKSFTPVIVRNYLRLFNLRPTHYRPSFRMSQLPIEVGAMNVEPCPGVYFNAVAFDVTERELVALDDRERYYERREVPICRFPDHHPLGIGSVYSSRPQASWIERDPARLLPRWDDIVMARNGCYAIDAAFGRMFDETTYLADGRTLVIDRYREALKSALDTEQNQQ